MKRLLSALLSAVLAIAASGCASAPDLRFYTLDMKPSGTVQSPLNVEITRLRPAEAVARQEIMIAKSATEIEYYAVDTWVANLGTLVTEKLQAEFGPPRAGEPLVVLEGEILRFGQVDTVDGAEAHIKLEVWARAAGARRSEPVVFKKTYETTVPAASKEPGDVVKALSKGLESLAVVIAEDMSSQLN